MWRRRRVNTAQIAGSLYRVFLGRDHRATFHRVETLDAALETDAEVIVIATDGDALNEVKGHFAGSQETKTRRYRRTGSDVVRQAWFGDQPSNCAGVMEYAPELVVMKANCWVRLRQNGASTVTKRDDSQPLDQAEKDRNRIVIQGLFQLRQEATQIDVIAPVGERRDYAYSFQGRAIVCWWESRRGDPMEQGADSVG